MSFARNTDPGTAHEAAASVSATDLETVVWRALRARGDVGGTSEEIADDTGLSRVTVSPRLRPLCNKGLIRDSGLRRRGTSNRPSIVWTLARLDHPST